MPIRVDQNNEVSSQTCVLATEMDCLIMKIQEGLRLKAKEKQHTYRHSRSTPYSFHCVGSKQPRASTKEFGLVLEPNCRRTILKANKPSDIELEPHQLLQKLLKEQTLIQEAVKRLQFQKKASSSEFEFETSDSEVDVNSNSTRVGKER